MVQAVLCHAVQGSNSKRWAPFCVTTVVIAIRLHTITTRGIVRLGARNANLGDEAEGLVRETALKMMKHAQRFRSLALIVAVVNSEKPSTLNAE